MERRLMDVQQLSEYLAMPKPTVYSYVSTGKIPAECIRRIGRALKFERTAIDAWISDQNAVQPTAQGHTQSAH